MSLIEDKNHDYEESLSNLRDQYESLITKQEQSAREAHELEMALQEELKQVK
jgi:hypothetical protein